MAGYEMKSFLTESDSARMLMKKAEERVMIRIVWWSGNLYL